MPNKKPITGPGLALQLFNLSDRSRASVLFSLVAPLAFTGHELLERIRLGWPCVAVSCPVLRGYYFDLLCKNVRSSIADPWMRHIAEDFRTGVTIQDCIGLVYGLKGETFRAKIIENQNPEVTQHLRMLLEEDLLLKKALDQGMPQAHMRRISPVPF